MICRKGFGRRRRSGCARGNHVGRQSVAETLETRRLLSAAVADADGHGDELQVDGDRYVAPRVLPNGKDAKRVDPKGLSTAFTLGDGGPIVREDRVEGEPNDDAPSSDFLPLATAAPGNTMSGTISSSTDVDYFVVHVPARSGLFLDIDAREIGLSSLDSQITVFHGVDGTTQLGVNDDGDDFETRPLNDTSATPRNLDSAFYADFPAGSYIIRISTSQARAATTGAYVLKYWADPNYTTTVPAFSSLPGAADTLYLDFDGHTGSDSWGSYTIAPYDWSGNASEWSPGERAAIETVWRVVAEDYAPFNINVTTSFAGTITNAASHRQVIGNSGGSEVGATGALGVAFLNAYVSGTASNNVSFTFANSFSSYVGSGGNSGQINSKAIEMGNTSSHEFGHALGLLHYGGTNPQNQALMHTPDFGLSRERWAAGNTHSGESPVVFQTDVDIISNATNTFGYRADDHGNSTGAATALGSVGATTVSRAGIIGTKTEVDFFSFTTTGGTASLSVTMLEHVTNLDAELRLYNASGTLLATSDSTTTVFANLSQTLAAGTYYAEVRSDGGEGEIGQYAMNVTVLGPNVSATPGTPDLSSISDTGASSSDNVTNRDNASSSATLQFSVPGTVAGALVELMHNGTVIGSATATGAFTTVTTDGTTSLGFGTRPITARQTEPGKLVSAESSALDVTIDTSDPRNSFDVLPQDVTTVGGTAYDIAVSYFDGNGSPGINVNTISTGDIQVNGPGGFIQLPALQSIDTSVPGNPVAVYRLVPPGGSWNFADNGAYTISTRDNEVADVAGNFRDAWTMGGFDVAIVDAPPTVTNVFVAGTAWNTAYRNSLVADGTGEAAFGYRIPASQQTFTLAWSNLNQVSIRFSENVTVASNDLTIGGLNVTSYGVISFAYDATTFTATWTLAHAIPNDKLTLNLDADAGTGVFDSVGQQLDGEWTNPSPPVSGGSDSFPSGNGTAGGDFVFNLRVLPGDLDRNSAVNVFDFNILKPNLNQTGRGVLNGDINGDNVVNIFDFNDFKTYLGKSIAL